MTFRRLVALVLLAAAAVGLFVLDGRLDRRRHVPGPTPAHEVEPVHPDQKLLDAIRTDVSRLRQLPFKRPVPLRAWTRDEVEDYILGELRKQWPPRQMRDDERAFKVMGLLPGDYALGDELVALYREQIIGLYDPRRKVMILVKSDVLKRLKNTFLAHELTHALQDQHFDLERRIAESTHTIDHGFCFSCVTEGDATIIMSEYLQEKMREDPGLLRDAFSMDLLTGSKRLLSAPPLMQHLLLGAYFRGMGFVNHFRRNGWGRVNELFADFPLSSEQVMHPEKYYPRRDFPKRIDLPDMTKQVVRGCRDTRWRAGTDTTLGEIGVLAMVQTWAQLLGADDLQESSEKIAAGWDGDRLVSVEHPTGETFVLWISTWDTPTDAREMHDALERWVTAWCARGTDANLTRRAHLVRPVQSGEPRVDVMCVLTVTRRGRAARSAGIPVYKKVGVRTTADLTPCTLSP